MLGNILSNKGADIFSESVVNEIIAQPMDHAYENAPASISRSYLMNLYKFYQGGGNCALFNMPPVSFQSSFHGRNMLQTSSLNSTLSGYIPGYQSIIIIGKGMSAVYLSGTEDFDYSNEQDAVAVWELLLSAARVSGISLGRGHPADERDIREIIDHEKVSPAKAKTQAAYCN